MKERLELENKNWFNMKGKLFAYILIFCYLMIEMQSMTFYIVIVIFSFIFCVFLYFFLHV